MQPLRPPADYAYAFLLAGCDPDKPSYRGFLFNELISLYILRESGSKADFVVFVRMSTDTAHSSLPPTEAQWLEELGAKIKYLDRPTKEDFDSAQMLKFHILGLVEYRRVLYLDSDIMPVCNLDYIFQLSDGDDPLIKENLVVAWTGEPSNGGFFMLRPGKGELAALQRIVKDLRDKGKWGAHFDPIHGWGHAITGDDKWVSLHGSGREWDFYASHSDQGLLYHWVKYVKQSVTIVPDGFTAENWAVNGNGTLHIENVLSHPFANYTCIPSDRKQARYAHHPAYDGNFLRKHPYSDYIHFYARFKPWEGEVAEPDVSDKHDAASGRQYWFHVLRKLNQSLNMGIDFDRWSENTATFGKAPYGDGRVPSFEDLKKNLDSPATFENITDVADLARISNNVSEAA